MKKSLIPASRLLYSPLTKGTGCNGGSCNTARAAPRRLLAGVPYAQPTIQLVAVTARAAASPRLVNSHASTYATPKKFHGDLASTGQFLSLIFFFAPLNPIALYVCALIIT